MDKTSDVISSPTASREYLLAPRKLASRGSFLVSLRLYPVSLYPETKVYPVFNNRILLSSYCGQPIAMAMAWPDLQEGIHSWSKLKARKITGLTGEAISII